MKLEPDDPRLSAWVLGELPPAEAEEVARAVEADPVLRVLADELRMTGDFLSGALAASALRPEQRAAVLEAGRGPAADVIRFPARKKPRPAWPAFAAAAAVLAAGLFFASRLETGNTRPLAGDPRPVEAETVLLRPLPGPRILPAKNGPAVPKHPLPRAVTDFPGAGDESLVGGALPEASQLPATLPLSPLQEASEIELPVLVGRSSYDWVRGWIRDKNQLPPKDAVRIEELANAFPLPPAEETRGFAGLRVACVSMTSLWSGPGRLVGVQIANGTREPKAVAWSFSPAPASRAGGVRVLASTGAGGGNSAALLPPGRRTLVLIELASAAGEAGDLVVETAGRSRRFPAVESRDSALKQAALVAAFGMWLRGEGIDDSRLDRILAAADEEAADPAWADSRRLVREALGIAAAQR